MKFTNRILSVDPNKGSVVLRYRVLGLAQNATSFQIDRALYLRDLLLLRPKQNLRLKSKEWTKHWGNVL